MEISRDFLFTFVTKFSSLQKRDSRTIKLIEYFFLPKLDCFLLAIDKDFNYFHENDTSYVKCLLFY